MSRPAVAEYPAGSRLPTRVIHDFEFVWMLQGRARFEADEGWALVPGQLLLIPPDVPHSFDWDPRRTTRHGYVHFDRVHLDGRLVDQPTLRMMTGHDPLAASCAYLLWLAQLPGDTWEPRVSATLEFMLEMYLAGPLPVMEHSVELAPPLQIAVQHLATEWSALPLRRIEIAELAAASSVSRGYLTRLFRTAFGFAPRSMLERIRFSRAEAMLERTDIGVEAIARHCGFADASHFSHRFSTVYGVSPRVYRSIPSAAPSVLDDAGTRRLAHLLWSEAAGDLA